MSQNRARDASRVQDGHEEEVQASVSIGGSTLPQDRVSTEPAQLNFRYKEVQEFKISDVYLIGHNFSVNF